MVNTNNRRDIRVGTNLIGNIYSESNPASIIFIENISAIGAKINSKNKHFHIGEVLNINFRYKNILYELSCKIVRSENNYRYGIQFYFKDESNKIANKNRLHQDILNEYFFSRRIH